MQLLLRKIVVCVDATQDNLVRGQKNNKNKYEETPERARSGREDYGEASGVMIATNALTLSHFSPGQNLDLWLYGTRE